ncbi:unnamed protein product [Linum trigynum]|uniref:Uncharacterized protein n=1 Tax=Linum trigynum TaxID=586398 RepID=A0AAV2F0I4_9ROSI
MPNLDALPESFARLLKGSSRPNISPSDVELLNDRLTTKDGASKDRLRARTTVAADSASPQKPKFDLQALNESI